MIKTPILNLRSVALSIGNELLFDGADLSVHKGDRIGLVGRNGTGKTTFLRLCAGQIESDSGECISREGLRIGFLEQDLSLAIPSSVGDFVAKDHEGVSDGYIPSQISSVLTSLGLSSGQLMEGLSGGEVRRAALARSILLKPDLLLLDEPTNHLDIGTIEWLEAWLLSFGGAVILVSHDRSLLRRVADKTIWISDKTLRVYGGNFDSFEVWAEDVKRLEAEAKKKLRQKLLQEERWLSRGVTARRKRNQGRLRRLKALRAERRESAERQKPEMLGPTIVPQGGALALETQNLSMQYEERYLVRKFSIQIRHGDRVAVVGPNGAGKTTLLRLLIGALTPSSGDIIHAPSTRALYFDQRRETLNPRSTVWETLCPQGGDIVDVGGMQQHVTGYLKRFLFSEKQFRQPIESLSGGEQSRLLFAKLFAQPGNLFGLDEPTNDLDMETLDLLQEIISDYRGTILFVSHDRDFIERVATSILVMDGTGTIGEHIGGYEDYRRSRPDPGRKNSKKRNVGRGETFKRRTSLSYNEKAELDRLPTEIERLYLRLKGLEQTLLNPVLYNEDQVLFEETTSELTLVKEKIELRESRWVELEERKEVLKER